MIDIESEIFTPLARELRTAFPGISVSGEYARVPSSFPHVSIVEEDNYSPQRFLDSGDGEKYAALLYEINVYSDRTPGKKGECKQIMAFISEMMYRANFVRLSCHPTPNLENASIYRMTARFRAVTDGERLFRP